MIHATITSRGALVAVGSLLLAMAPTVQATDSVWSATALTVHVVLCDDGSPEFTSRMRTSIQRHIEWTFSAGLGAACHFQIEWLDATRLGPFAADWHWLAALTEAEPFRAAEKLIGVRFSTNTLGYVVEACEWDLRCQLLNPGQPAPLAHRAALGPAARQVVIDVLRPVAQVVAVQRDEVQLAPRAADLMPADQTWPGLSPGDILQVVLRVDDRDGQPRVIRTVEWTYLVVQRHEGRRVVCQLVTGLRSPVGTYRGRSQWLAIPIPQTRFAATRLRLVDRDDANRRLAGYQVYRSTADAAPPSTSPAGTTDAVGEILIERSNDPLLVLRIARGSEPLARLPLVPGLHAELAVALAADDLRLEAEGVVAGLQEQFLDLVARRRILAARIERLIEQQRHQEAVAVLGQLKQLGTTAALMQTIREQQTRFRAPDPQAQERIDRLFSETLQLISRYDDPRLVPRLEALVASPPAS